MFWYSLSLGLSEADCSLLGSRRRLSFCARASSAHLCSRAVFQQEATLSTLFVSCLSLILPILSPVILDSAAKRSLRRTWRGSLQPCPATRCAVIVSILLVGALGLQIFQRQALLDWFVSSSTEITENI